MQKLDTRFKPQTCFAFISVCTIYGNTELFLCTNLQIDHQRPVAHYKKNKYSQDLGLVFERLYYCAVDGHSKPLFMILSFPPIYLLFYSYNYYVMEILFTTINRCATAVRLTSLLCPDVLAEFERPPAVSDILCISQGSGTE